jgi:hypothetical protein
MSSSVIAASNVFGRDPRLAAGQLPVPRCAGRRSDEDRCCVIPRCERMAPSKGWTVPDWPTAYGGAA